MAKQSWGAVTGQFAKLAEEGRAERAKASQIHEAKGSKPDEAINSKPDELSLSADITPAPIETEAVAEVEEVRRAEPTPAPIPKRGKAVEPPSKVEKRSTSLYLSGGAMRALKTLAAKEGVRPHRVIDDALRAHFKRKGLDFDELNATN